MILNDLTPSEARRAQAIRTAFWDSAVGHIPAMQTQLSHLAIADLNDNPDGKIVAALARKAGLQIVPCQRVLDAAAELIHFQPVRPESQGFTS